MLANTIDIHLNYVCQRRSWQVKSSVKDRPWFRLTNRCILLSIIVSTCTESGENFGVGFLHGADYILMALTCTLRAHCLHCLNVLCDTSTIMTATYSLKYGYTGSCPAPFPPPIAPLREHKPFESLLDMQERTRRTILSSVTCWFDHVYLSSIGSVRGTRGLREHTFWLALL